MSGGADRVLEVARLNGVFPAVAAALREVSGVGSDTLEALGRYQIQRAARELCVREDLRWFAGQMAEAGLGWLTFKGPTVARLLYHPDDLRTYQDLDLCLRRADFAAGIEALEAAGAHILDRNWTLIRREGRGQLHLVLPLGTVADVHWHLLNRRAVRDSFAIDMDGVFERARAVQLDGLAVRTLDPVDTLVHLGLHAALGGADRLMWMDDVRRSLLVEAPPWDEVIARARAWRAASAAAVTFRRARLRLGAPVPDDALIALDGSRTRREIGAWIDGRWSEEASHGRRSLAALWPQLVRDGAGATARTMLHRTAMPVLAVSHRLVGEPGLDHGAEVGAVFKESGTAAERRRYLREVVGGTA